MYFPYLRGKQYELLALRESAAFMSIHKTKVSPIIEPVKNIMPSLEKALYELARKGINFNVIINPSVGDLKGKADDILQSIKRTLRGYENYQLAFLVNGNKSWSVIESIVKRIDFNYGGITLIHIEQVDDIASKIDSIGGVKYNIVSDDISSRRYYRYFDPETKVSLSDYFKAQTRNSDYRHNDDEMFTDDHVYFDSEGLVGFGDYLTIGKAYNDSGFMPYAVAIHLTYARSIGKDEELRVRHFVCDSFEDSSDISGKFEEALYKLVAWVPSSGCKSSAIDEFMDYYSKGHFPGLGTIKKLSIKHHIETIL